MCLFLNAKRDKRYRFRHKNKKTITVYKVVKKTKHSKGLQSLFRCKPIKGGWYKSNRKNNTQLSYREKATYLVQYGIHVFTTRAIASYKAKHDSRKVVIACTAYMKDLVASGYYREAVFTKVWIPAAEIRKALSQ